jgi:hypothetical protein
VCVVEPGEREVPFEVDHARARAGERRHLRGRPRGRAVFAGHRERLDETTIARPSEDPAVHEEKIGPS